MCHYTSRVAALALVAGALACSDRPPGTAPDAPPGEPGILAEAARPELLARSLALALGDPAFRAHVKGELDRSPFREHKVSFQRFLAAGTGGGSGGAALATMARRSGLNCRSASTDSSAPRKRTEPAVGRISCKIALPTVVLPQPDSPTSASVRPGASLSDTPSTALTWLTARRSRPRRIGK